MAEHPLDSANKQRLLKRHVALAASEILTQRYGKVVTGVVLMQNKETADGVQMVDMEIRR